MMQCCDAMIHIHERKKVHLGICPENILYQLSSWKNIDIMVEALDNVTDIVELERSLPKQLQYNVFIPEYHATHSNKELSFASDIFCLGVVFYQLLSRDLVSFFELLYWNLKTMFFKDIFPCHVRNRHAVKSERTVEN